MNRNDKRAPDEIEDEDDSESHAADEPTAVWDESALRAAGLTDLFNKRKSDPPPPPATPATPADRPSIEVSEEMARALAPAPEAAREAQPVASVPAGGGMGWGATLALAVLLGGLVYGLIRFVKG